MDERTMACAVQERLRRILAWFPSADGRTERSSLVEAQHQVAVLLVGGFEPLELPPLALVAPQVIDIEGAAGPVLLLQLALDLDQPLAGGVDGRAPQVHPDPAPPQLFCDGES